MSIHLGADLLVKYNQKITCLKVMTGPVFPCFSRGVLGCYDP